MNIINLLDDTEMKTWGHGAKYGGAERPLGKPFGAKLLGFHVETMDPKTFSCPYHYHDEAEELFIVLEGSAVIRCNNEYRKVTKGDLIYYGTGPTSAHQMYNHTDKPFRFFALSADSPSDACVYPDSHKGHDKTTHKMMQNGVQVDYWKDEEDPSVHWPDHALRGEV